MRLTFGLESDNILLAHGAKPNGASFPAASGVKLYKQYSARLFLHTRGYSSAGRALEWHSRGQRFDPAYLHHRRCAEYSFLLDLPFGQVFLLCGSEPRTSCIFIRPPPAAGRRLPPHRSAVRSRLSPPQFFRKLVLGASFRTFLYFLQF